jgi:two-component system CheB/CheR fusion protein
MSEVFSDNDLFGAEREHKGAGEEFLIVGIGASAGGILALKEFFAQVPADSAIAYVVILHLSPDHESRLAEVLQVTAAIPVTQVKEGVRVEPNHVYVIPPHQSLAMRDGHLTLSEMTRIEERRAPVDIFFRTLAESHHARAVCIILSGTGADGSMGMKRVKEYGGICIVQEPNEAEYSDMPRHSIATGLVDYVLPVAEIPAKIIAYKKHLGTVRIPAEPPTRPELEAQALRDIFTQLRVRTGHDFANYKRSTVLRRIERRINVHELPDLPAYARYLREQPQEAQALLKDLLISVTNFFRDSEPFAALEQNIIPKLFENKEKNDYVRVWVAGCATGEEAYSLAMLLSEFTAHMVNAPNVQLFATDIDEWAISKARGGFYTLNDAADVSPERLRMFFSKEARGYRVRREIREMVLFATHNIIKDPPFSHLDLVTCRNLLIYLNRTAQERVMEVLHFALNPGGYLFLGTSESIEGSRDLFTVIDKENHIFQGRPVEARLPLPLPNISLTTRGLPLNPYANTLETHAHQRLSYLEVHQRLLEQYAPPSVIVNEDYTIVHLSERAGRYMHVAGGEPSHDLLKTVRPELRLELRTALYQATQNRTSVEARGLRVSINGRTEHVNLIVKPVLSDDAATRGFMLVLFEEESAAGAAEGEPSQTVISSAEPIARQLEEELMRVKAQLLSTMEQHEVQQEELKASNEELQAMNEELRSATEELETGKEELQSVNEELTTVNQELKIKIEELSQSNNDFQNLMNSTDIGTIFLDRGLRLKLFTPRASDIFNLIPADIGRPLADINSKLIYDHLLPDIEHVIESLRTTEREIETQDGRWYLLWLLPYRITEDRINGVVLTFLDITNRKLAEEALRRSEERLRLLMESIEDFAIFSIDTNGHINSWNTGAERIFGYTAEEAIGQQTEIIFTPEDRAQGAPEDEMRRAREKGRAADERWYVRKNGERFYASGVMSPLRDGSMRGYAKVARDLTEQKHAAEALHMAHEDLETSAVEHTRELAGANESLRKEAVERELSDAARVRLLRKLVSAQEDERRRIALDLHDHLGQQLTALRLKLETLKNRPAKDAEFSAQVEQTQVIARQIESDVDFLAWELRPAALDDLGLKDTLANYIKNWSGHFNIQAEFHTTGLDNQRIAPEIEANLYRIAQEALNNIYKHGQATRVDVILERYKHYVLLIIEDDGVGFVPNPTPDKIHGMGLVGMRERAAFIGGTMEIESVPGTGTTLFVRVPVSLPEEGEA